MSSQSGLTAMAVIESHRQHADFAGPQPETYIRECEEALGLTFPPSYREFLLKLGCGNFGPIEFYGVLQKDPRFPPGAPDAVWLTQEDRKAGLPAEYIIVAVTGDGGDYVIDTSQRQSSGESPVMEFWQTEPRGKDNPRLVAPSYGDFLLERVTFAIQCIEESEGD